MNLLFHQLRCDLRANRIGLALWFVVLALGLAVNLGGIGTWQHHGEALLGNGAIFWEYAVLVMQWLLFMLLPAIVVLSNSPAKTDSFLDTRPMPKGAVHGAQILFVLCWMALPAMLQEWMHLTARGLSTGLVVHGALERLMWALPWLGVSAGFTALWRNGKEWSAALVATFVGVVIFTILVNFIPQEPKVDVNSRPVVFLYAIASLIVLLAALNHHFRWSVWKRATGLLVMIVVCLGMLFLPLRVLPSKQHAPEKSLAESPFAVRPQNIHVSCSYKTNSSGTINLTASVTPEYELLPQDTCIDWSVQTTRLVTESGQVAASFVNDRQSRIFIGQYNVAGAQAQALAKFLGPNALVFVQPGMFVRESSAGLGQLEISESLLKTKTSLQADLTGNVFRWEVVTNLALVEGKSATTAFGGWKILGAKINEPAFGHQTRVALELDQIRLSTSRQAMFEDIASETSSRFGFVLYDEVSGRARFSDWSTWSHFIVGAETAFPRIFLLPVFNDDSSFGNFGKTGSAEHLKLVILQKKYLGTLHQHWASPVFIPGDHLNVSSWVNQMQNEQLSQAEFKQRLAAMAVPGPTASRMEVGIYLNDVLRLIDARRSWLNDGSPLLTQMAALVPKYLDVFMAGIPATAGWSQDALLRAITQGAEERQKGEIIAALPRAQALAQVVVKRGWLTEARPTLTQLFDRPAYLDMAAFQANAWFGDAIIEQKLLEAFTFNPTLERYKILSALPGLAVPLDQTVKKIYENWPHIIDNAEQMPEALTIGLAHGLPEALTEAYRINALLPANLQNWHGGFFRTMSQHVEIPGAKPENLTNPTWMNNWMKTHQAGDFRYDPARGRFVLKTI